MATSTSKNTSQESDGHPAALNDAEFKKELTITKLIMRYRVLYLKG